MANLAFVKPTGLKLKLRMNNIFLEPVALFIYDNPSHFSLQVSSTSMALKNRSKRT